MTEIVIGVCDLRIRRPANLTAPWLDGDDHRAMARRVQALVLPMLEELLAPRLEKSGTTGAASLTLDLRLAAHDLAGAAPLARPGLRSRLAEAVEVALERAHAESRSDLRPTPPPAGTMAAPALNLAPRSRADSAAQGLARYLRHLLREGADGALSLLPEAALIRLLARLLELVRIPHPARSAASADRPEAADERLGPPSRRPDRREVTAALKALVAVLSPSVVPGALFAAPNKAAAICVRAADVLARIQATETRADTGRPRTPARPPEPRDATGLAREMLRENTAEPAREANPPPAASPDAVPAGPAQGRHQLDHALPFLSLAMLARRDIVTALALDASDPATLAAVAAAVALKSLPRDHRGGWASGAQRAAALAAGLRTPPGGADFARASGRLADDGAFSRAGIAVALVGSLHPHGTLPLVAAGERVVLFDPGGLYPVAADTPASLVPLLRDTGRTLFLSPPDGALWAALEAAGLPVVADGPALRSERAEPVAGPHGWRGHATGAVRFSGGRRAHLPEDAATAARAAEVWQAFGGALVARPAETGRTRRFDELAALLAGFALADIGWALFRRDPASWAEPDPLLVRERFADLAGWLEVGSARLTVTLPLGRRFTDLRDAGLLDTVDPAPLWPGREIAFQGG